MGPGRFRLLLLVVLLGLLPSLSQAAPILINPSFETGDFTGWDSLMLPDHMKIVSGTTSEGTCYLTAEVNWMHLANTHGMPSWHWQAGCWQSLTVPLGINQMSVDVRAVGFDQLDPFSTWSVAITETISLEEIGIAVDVPKYAQTAAPAPNGFTRYTVDISGIAPFNRVSISIVAAGNAYAIPSGPIEFSVDNIQFLPEPGTLALLTAGGCLGLRTRRR
jgi:hypothetical protein